MLMEVSRLGWSMSDSGTAITMHDGEGLDLLVTSPAFVCLKAQEAYKFKQLSSLGRQFGFAGRACAEPLLAALQKCPSARERSNLEAFGSGGLWTNQRLADAGYLIQGSCTKCGRADSVRHRVHECQADDVVEVRSSVLGAEADDLRQCLEDPSFGPMLDAGWIPDPFDSSGGGSLGRLLCPIPGGSVRSLMALAGGR